MQEEGWPLGLQPLNMRAGVANNHDFSGSMSFNTLLTGSPTSSTASSSDLDTESVLGVKRNIADGIMTGDWALRGLWCGQYLGENLTLCSHERPNSIIGFEGIMSTGSFFHDKSITLGSLIGVSSILELSRRSTRGRRADSMSLRSKKSSKSRGWFLSLCSKAEDAISAPSLAHFLEVERRASNDYRSNQNSMIYDADEYTASEPNLLFINGHVAPPQSSPWLRSNDGERTNRSLANVGACGVPVLCSCMCGQPTN
ncbi:hypothetical protein IFM89_036629 [Coptis chinensis]|uniref:Uncharacterized protein n=1 Tax=Coptis chinensis TaxID=261450 RepID=A0A835HHW5_9MAGN|nr:hypothetical protein IFM89_036629 [Coptis chinensis]